MRRGSRLSRRRRRGEEERRGGEERRRGEEERRGGEEQATDIKSNNPHLAGGEKQFDVNEKPIETCGWKWLEVSPARGATACYSPKNPSIHWISGKIYKNPLVVKKSGFPVKISPKNPSNDPWVSN